MPWLMKAEPDSRVVKGKDVKVCPLISWVIRKIVVDSSSRSTISKRLGKSVFQSDANRSDGIEYHLGMVCFLSFKLSHLTSGVRSHEAKKIMKEKMKLGDKVTSAVVVSADGTDE